MMGFAALYPSYIWYSGQLPHPHAATRGPRSAASVGADGWLSIATSAKPTARSWST